MVRYSTAEDQDYLTGGQIMEARSRVRCGLVALVLVGCLAGMAIQPLFAQAVIPDGATIDQADFSIRAVNDTGQIVNLYRITADWAELVVTWNSFSGNFDPTLVGSFFAGSGWNSVDVTALVQAWVDGDAPNFGILLEQGNTDFTRYHSSEYGTVNYRPKLEVWYTSPSGVFGYVLIQRPGDAQDGVMDAYISAATPDLNRGAIVWLYTGLYNEYEKQSLIRFLFDVEEPPDGPGTGTPGYWKNHPDAWPVETIEVGGVQYAKADAIAIMKQRVKDDMTIAMFKSLVAAKLNVLIGNDDSCILPDIQAADEWLMYNPAGSGVPAGGIDSPWREGEPIHLMLDDYNNGLLECADPRD